MSDLHTAAGLALGALCSFGLVFPLGLLIFLADTFVPGACERKGAS